MNPTDNMTDYLQSLKKAKQKRADAAEYYRTVSSDYAKAFVPVGGTATTEKLSALYETCSSKGDFSRSDFFICSALLIYSPEALFGGKIPLRLAKDIAHLIPVKYNYIYMVRKKVSLWLTIYPDFYREVFRIYDRYRLMTVSRDGVTS